MILTVERSINRKDIFWSKLKLRDVQKKFNDVSLQFEALDDVSRLPASKLRTYVVGELLFMQEHLPSLSEVERRVVAEKLDKSLAFIYSLAWKGGDIASLSLLTRLNRNQLLLDIERRQAISARATGAAHVTLRRLTNLTILLSNPMVSDSDLRRAFVESQRVQKELWRILPELQPRLVEPSAVAKQLPADGMLIEFQRYAPFDPLQPEATQWGSPRYLAMVLGPSGLMQTVDLGSAEQLEQRITTALERTRDRVPEAAASWGQVADYVFLPLQSSLAGRRRLLISPDGALHRVPFGALALLAGSSSSLPAGVWLQTIGSGRDLVPVASANPQTRSTSPLVLAAPTTTGWEPLPAAIKEGSAVASSLRTLLHQGEAAKVALLEQARGPKLIHVAGHGYFDAQASGDPLLASGLVLAGADRAHLPSRAVYSEASGGAAKTKLTTTTALDDGYLTAKEAARLQLDGTELVVLSACETGLGQERTGEGLFGLQRALTVAGARGTLLSLWKVPDQASQTFMERFYALLKQGKAADQAVRQVQEEFRDQPTIGGQPKPGAWSDPYYWAAWQYTGVPDSPR
jgi:CHAT domain-containing protein